MSGHTAQSRFTPWKAGDRILVEAIVESVFDGVTNWPVKLLLDHGASETIDASRNVHYSAIHPMSALSDSHAELVKALEDTEQHLAFQHKWLSDQFDAMGRTRDEGTVGADTWEQIEATYALWTQVKRALATLTARKVG